MIKIIHGGMGSGKTVMLIKEAAKVNAYIICRDHRYIQEICKMADILKLDINHPLTFDEFKRGSYYAHGIKGGFMIDNACELLQSYSTVPIEIITTSGALKWLKITDNPHVNMERLKESISIEQYNELINGSWDIKND